MKRKKRTALPRVTLLAYSRRDLLAFAESVETLRLLVADLRAVAANLAIAGVALGRRRAGPAPKATPSLKDVPLQTGTGGTP